MPAERFRVLKVSFIKKRVEDSQKKQRKKHYQKISQFLTVLISEKNCW